MKNALFVIAGILLASMAFGLGRPGALPEARAQGTAATNAETGPVMMTTGGSQPNQNDLCWVLFRDKGRDRVKNTEHDRYALCLYRALNNGQAFDLVDFREVTYDCKLVQPKLPGHNPLMSPQAIKDILDRQKKMDEETNHNKPQ